MHSPQPPSMAQSTSSSSPAATAWSTVPARPVHAAPMQTTSSMTSSNLSAQSRPFSRPPLLRTDSDPTFRLRNPSTAPPPRPSHSNASSRFSSSAVASGKRASVDFSSVSSRYPPSSTYRHSNPVRQHVPASEHPAPSHPLSSFSMTTTAANPSTAATIQPLSSGFSTSSTSTSSSHHYHHQPSQHTSHAPQHVAGDSHRPIYWGRRASAGDVLLLPHNRRRHSLEQLDFNCVSIGDLPSFLRALRLHKYTECLSSAGVTLEVLMEIDDAGLEKAGVLTQGARKRLLLAVQKYKRYCEGGTLSGSDESTPSATDTSAFSFSEWNPSQLGGLPGGEDENDDLADISQGQSAAAMSPSLTNFVPDASATVRSGSPHYAASPSELSKTSTARLSGTGVAINSTRQRSSLPARSASFSATLDPASGNASSDVVLLPQTVNAPPDLAHRLMMARAERGSAVPLPQSSSSQPMPHSTLRAGAGPPHATSVVSPPPGFDRRVPPASASTGQFVPSSSLSFPSVTGAETSTSASAARITASKAPGSTHPLHRLSLRSATATSSWTTQPASAAFSQFSTPASDSSRAQASSASPSRISALPSAATGGGASGESKSASRGSTEENRQLETSIKAEEDRLLDWILADSGSDANNKADPTKGRRRRHSYDPMMKGQLSSSSSMETASTSAQQDAASSTKESSSSPWLSALFSSMSLSAGTDASSAAIEPSKQQTQEEHSGSRSPFAFGGFQGSAAPAKQKTVRFDETAIRAVPDRSTSLSPRRHSLDVVGQTAQSKVPALRDWLTQLRLQRIVDHVIAAGIDEEHLIDLSSDELDSLLIPKSADRDRLLSAIDNYRHWIDYQGGTKETDEADS